MTHADESHSTQPQPTAHPASAGASPVASSGSIDTIRPMVAEIRNKLASIAAREIALQRREQELTQQLAALEAAARDAAGNELRDSRSRLEKRSDELNAQAIELATRAGRLQRAEAALEVRRQELERRAAELDAREQSEASRRNEHDTALEQRAAAIREKERDLERRIVRARDEIVRLRAELEDQSLALERRTQELETRAADIITEDADLQRRIAGYESSLRDLDKRRDEIESARRELERRQLQNQQLTQQLEQQRQILNGRQRELDQRSQQARKQREKFLAQVDELRAQQVAIREQQAALEQHAQRLQERDQQLQTRAENLDQDERNLDERASAMRLELERLAARDIELLQRDADLQRARDELFSLREAVETRDAEARQATLAVELERQDLAQQRMLLERAHEDLAQARAELDQKRSDETAELSARRAALQRAERSLVVAPRRWLLRSVVLAAAAAAAIGGIWSLSFPAIYTVAAGLVLNDSPEGTEAAIARHAAGLADRNRLELLLREAGEAGMAERVAAQDLSVVSAIRVAARGNTLTLELTGPSATELESIARRCMELHTVAADELLTARFRAGAANSVEQYAELRKRADDLQRQMVEARALLSLIPATSRDAILAETRALETERREAADRLTVVRGELDDLLSGRRPEGVIDPAALAAALEEDVVHQEDIREMAEQIRRYRTELAVAMIAMLEPVSSLRGRAAELRTLIAEQRGLQPPPGVATILEELAGEAESFEVFVADLSNQWSSRRTELERNAGSRSAVADLDQALVQLVDHQQQVADLARRLLARLSGLSQNLTQNIARLTGESGGGTRAFVVAGLLRSVAAALAEQSRAAEDAAAATDPTTSFQLDACDRQLRGLRTRMQQRRDALRQQLQLEADRDASASHAAATDRLRAEIVQIESRRENAIATLAEKLEELRQLDEQEARRATLTQQVELLQAERDRVNGELSRLERFASAATQPSALRDDVVFLPIETRRDGISGMQAGATAFFTVFSSCLLMVIRRPGSRSRVEPIQP